MPSHHPKQSAVDDYLSHLNHRIESTPTDSTEPQSHTHNRQLSINLLSYLVDTVQAKIDKTHTP